MPPKRPTTPPPPDHQRVLVIARTLAEVLDQVVPVALTLAARQPGWSWAVPLLSKLHAQAQRLGLELPQPPPCPTCGVRS
jgi:hypothetical protein